MIPIEQRAKQHQQRRAEKLAAYRREFGIREAAAQEVRMAIVYRRRAQAEAAELVRAEAARKQYEALREQLNLTPMTAGLYTSDDIKLLQPCHRYNAVAKLIGNRWHDGAAVDINVAIDAGATYHDIAWVLSKLARVNTELNLLFKTWTAAIHASRGGRNLHRPRARLELLQALVNKENVNGTLLDT